MATAIGDGTGRPTARTLAEKLVSQPLVLGIALFESLAGTATIEKTALTLRLQSLLQLVQTVVPFLIMPVKPAVRAAGAWDYCPGVVDQRAGRGMRGDRETGDTASVALLARPFRASCRNGS